MKDSSCVLPALPTDFSSACLGFCGAKCCRRGVLPLLARERALFSSERIDERGHYTLEGGCEHLDHASHRCKIYLVRPEKCRTFPYLMLGKTTFVFSFCPVAEEKISHTGREYKVI